MKRKLFIVLFVVTVLAGGVSYHMFQAMNDVTRKLQNIISVHKIQTARVKLGFQLRIIHEKLIVKDTPYEIFDPDTIIGYVELMDSTMHSCFRCHHEEHSAALLRKLQADIDGFKSALSRVITLRATNKARYHEAAWQAYERGDRLLQQTDEMLSSTSTRLEQRSSTTMVEAMRIMRFVTISILALPICMLLVGIYLMRSITRPIEALIMATDKLGQGSFDYRVSGLKDEFGRLGNSFNVMAESLANQMRVTQRAEQMTVVGQMAAGLAHEIKNPLAGIKVSMEVLKGESYIHDQDRQVLAMVVAVINRINTLINDLLNYARPSEPRLQSLSLNALLQQTVTSATYSLTRPHSEDSAKSPSVTCTAALTPGLPNIKGDPGQLQQIFLNLILNAFDAMQQGGTVTVSSSLMQGTAFVAVNVTDTGPGIDDEIREKIFIPFFSTKKKGTGLGLAICKTLIEQSGGKITVNKNIEGGGAWFSVFLPIADAQGAA